MYVGWWQTAIDSVQKGFSFRLPWGADAVGRCLCVYKTTMIHIFSPTNTKLPLFERVLRIFLYASQLLSALRRRMALSLSLSVLLCVPELDSMSFVASPSSEPPWGKPSLAQSACAAVSDLLCGV